MLWLVICHPYYVYVCVCDSEYSTVQYSTVQYSTVQYSIADILQFALHPKPIFISQFYSSIQSQLNLSPSLTLCVCVWGRKCQKVIVIKCVETVTVSERMVRYSDTPSYSVCMSKLIELCVLELPRHCGTVRYLEFSFKPVQLGT